MSEEKTIITDAEIETVNGNANFGSMPKRDIVKYGLLKCASGWYQGSTSTAILEAHNLIDRDYNLTAKGRMYLWESFKSDRNP